MFHEKKDWIEDVWSDERHLKFESAPQKSEEWMKRGVGGFTASKMRSIITATSKDTVLNRMIDTHNGDSSSFSTSPATEHGNANEDVVASAYQMFESVCFMVDEYLRENAEMSETDIEELSKMVSTCDSLLSFRGFSQFANLLTRCAPDAPECAYRLVRIERGCIAHPKYGYIRASVDGDIHDKKTKTWWLTEIKAPFTKKFYHTRLGTNDVKRTKPVYYTQMQTQMEVRRKHHLFNKGTYSLGEWQDKCAFAVGIPDGLSVEMVTYDKEHAELIISKASYFYGEFSKLVPDPETGRLKKNIIEVGRFEDPYRNAVYNTVKQMNNMLFLNDDSDADADSKSCVSEGDNDESPEEVDDDVPSEIICPPCYRSIVQNAINQKTRHLTTIEELLPVNAFLELLVYSHGADVHELVEDFMESARELQINPSEISCNAAVSSLKRALPHVSELFKIIKFI